MFWKPKVCGYTYSLAIEHRFESILLSSCLILYIIPFQKSLKLTCTQSNQAKTLLKQTAASPTHSSQRQQIWMHPLHLAAQQLAVCVVHSMVHSNQRNPYTGKLASSKAAVCNAPAAARGSQSAFSCFDNKVLNSHSGASVPDFGLICIRLWIFTTLTVLHSFPCTDTLSLKE